MIIVLEEEIHEEEDERELEAELELEIELDISVFEEEDETLSLHPTSDAVKESKQTKIIFLFIDYPLIELIFLK